MKPYEFIDGGLYKVGDKVVKYDFSSHYFVDGKYHYALSRSGPRDVTVVTPITFTIAPLEPIPLTAEILEKNGLDKVPELSMVLNRDTMPLYHSPMLYYVHELQHALRLCGLNELADNFKV